MGRAASRIVPGAALGTAARTVAEVLTVRAGHGVATEGSSRAAGRGAEIIATTQRVRSAPATALAETIAKTHPAPIRMSIRVDLRGMDAA